MISTFLYCILHNMDNMEETKNMILQIQNTCIAYYRHSGQRYTSPTVFLFNNNYFNPCDKVKFTSLIYLQIRRKARTERIGVTCPLCLHIQLGGPLFTMPCAYAIQ